MIDCDGGVYLGFENNDSIFHHNNFIDSIHYGSQAYDAGYNNVWYQSGQGNYWSDWGGTGVYDIGGEAENTDPYPLGSMAIADWNQLSIPNIDDFYEHNDDWMNLKTLSVNQEYSLYAQDDDWFKLENLVQSYEIEIILKYDSSEAKLRLYFHEEDYMLVDNDTSTSSTLTINYLITHTNYYSIEVDFISGNLTEYTLEINYSESQYTDDSFEDNDSSFEAADLIPTECTQELFYLDDDFFVVQIAKNWNYTFQITFDNTKIDLDMYLISNYSYQSVSSTTNNDVEVFSYKQSNEDTEYAILLITCDLTEINDFTPSPYVLTVTTQRFGASLPNISIVILAMVVIGVYRRKRKRR